MPPNKKFLLISGVIVVILILGFILIQRPEGSIHTPLPSAKELRLSDFPEVFKENTLIIVGDNASEIEVQAANEIAEYLANETGNKPLIKKYSEVTEEDKKRYNLIVVGTPESNEMLKDIYAIADVIKVNESFPGEGKGILEIARNPWNEERAMLLVEGWENDGLLFSYNEALKIIGWNEKYRKSDGEEKTFVGTIDLGATFGSSWQPHVSMNAHHP